MAGIVLYCDVAATGGEQLIIAGCTGIGCADMAMGCGGIAWRCGVMDMGCAGIAWCCGEMHIGFGEMVIGCGAIGCGAIGCGDMHGSIVIGANKPCGRNCWTGC